MKKLFALILSFFAILALCSCSSDDTLIVYTEAGFAPFEYVDNGQIVGVDVDIMNKVGEKLGKKVVFENVSFDTIVDAVSAGKLTNVGAAGLSVTEERKEKVDFSTVYYQANLYVIYNKNNISSGFIHTMTDGVDGVYWSSLKSNKGVGVQTGTTADIFLGDEMVEGGSLYEVKKTDYSSLDTAINDIGLNIDYLVVDELPAKKLSSSKAELECLPLYYEGEEDEAAFDSYAICVTKGETELLAAINTVLAELLVEDENGINGIDVLVQHHLGIEVETEELNFFEALYRIVSTPKYLEYLFSGFLNTLLLTVIAALIGLSLGFVVAVIKILAPGNKYLKIPNAICGIYTTIIRGTPVALQLFIMVFAILAIPGFKVPAVILTFGINSGAYVSESIRAGILSVDKGQMEAGRALGLSKLKTMVKIILPQAVKNVVPAIGNELIALVKETAIVSMIGSTIGTLTFDLNQAASTINKGVANYLAPATLTAILYLAIVYGITLVIKLIERRLGKSDRN